MSKVAPLHPSHLWHYVGSQLRASATSYLCCTAATIGLLTGLGKTPFEKVLIFGGATLTAGAAVASRRTVVETQRTIYDYDDVLSQNRQNWMFEATRPDVGHILDASVVNAAAPVSEAGWFDWESIRRDKDEYAHLFLVTKTGGGKSWLAEWLSDVLKDSPDPEKGLDGSMTIAVVPHYQYGDYATADLILGHGRNYGTDARQFEIIEKKNSVQVIGEPEIPFDRILAGSKVPTVCQFLRALHTEMDRRYQLNQQGYRIGGRFINVILDEFPAYSNLPGVRDCIKELIREARKVGIRLIILAQGSEVKTLGIEGEGSLRENLTFIRLKKFALKYLDDLVGKLSKDDPRRQWWETVKQDFRQCPRPAMVEDMPAIVPDLRQWRQLTGSNPTLPIGFKGQGSQSSQAKQSVWNRYAGEPTQETPDDFDGDLADEEPQEDVQDVEFVDLGEVFFIEGASPRLLADAESYLNWVDHIILSVSKKFGWVDTKRCLAYVRSPLRNLPKEDPRWALCNANYIRHRFEWLASHGWGYTKGENGSMEFLVNQN